MFASLGRTWDLTKLSWRVLKKDRELVLFPVFAAVALLILAGLMSGIGAATGTLARLDGGTEQLTAVDVGLLAVTYFLLAFVLIYFNAALIGAAMVRLGGGDPHMRDGFRLANRRLPQILGWALISATVGLLLQALRNQSRDNFLGQIAISLVGGVWAYLTFFVVPVLVAEGIGPIAAIKRSGSLFKRTWGEQVVANFGFGLLSLGAALIGALPAVAIASISVPAGIAVGVVTVGLGLAVVASLEAIFKSALYGYVADGRVAEGFTRESLAGAYRPGSQPRGA
jgi:hypothetical protein